MVLLSRNPGFHPDDVSAHGRADFAAACRGNLVHRPAGHPFYLLDPAFQETPGGQYWRRKLRHVAERVRSAIGADGIETVWKMVAQGVFSVEYHGYHSPLYRPLGATLLTQRYGFALVAAAVRRGAVVLALRSVRDWMDAVPELRGYEKFFRALVPPRRRLPARLRLSGSVPDLSTARGNGNLYDHPGKCSRCRQRACACSRLRLPLAPPVALRRPHAVAARSDPRRPRGTCRLRSGLGQPCSR